MSKKISLLFTLFIVIVGAIVFFAIRKDYHEIMPLFSKLNVLWLLVAIGLFILYNLLDVVFYYYAFRKEKRDYTFINALQMQQVGNFFSLIDPFGGSGNAVEPVILKKQGISIQYGTSIVMLTFISYQAILIIFTSAIIFTHLNLISVNSVMGFFIFLGYIINFIVIAGLFLGSVSVKIQNFLIRIISFFIRKLRFIKKPEKMINNIIDTFTGFRSDFKNLFKQRQLLIYRLITDFLKLTVYFSITYFLIKALNIPMYHQDFIKVFVFTSFVYMVSSITPTPGSVGGAEATFLVVFGTLLHGATSSVMLLWRTLVTYLPMLIGFFFAAFVMKKKKEKS